MDPQDEQYEQRMRYHRGYHKLKRRIERQSRPQTEGRGQVNQRQSRWQYDEDDEFIVEKRASRAPRREPKRRAAEVELVTALVVGTSRQQAELVPLLELEDFEAGRGALPETHTVRLVPGAERPVVGDLADVAADWTRIEALSERRTELTRPDPKAGRRDLVIAANVDLGLIVVAAAEPAFRPGLIDRALVALERGGVEPVIVITKADLVDDRTRATIDAHLALYAELDIDVFWTAAPDPGDPGCAVLLERTAGQTCVLVGHSGVGKSSLLNRLDPSRARATNTGREYDGKGRHTTTASELSLVAGGTRLIDTPGVRAFGLSDPEHLIDAFPDLAAAARDCRFRNCRHDGDPGCALEGTADTVLARRFEILRRLRVG